MNCQPGDLAVVISASNKYNIGRVVTVIRPFDGTGGLCPDTTGACWLVRCSTPLKWVAVDSGKVYRRKEGPAPDACLQPIRGIPKRMASVVISTSLNSPRVHVSLRNPPTLKQVPD